MLTIINEVLRRHGTPRELSAAQIRLNKIQPFLSHQTNKLYKQFFDDQGLGDILLFNGEFQLLVGGPKWVKPDHPDDVFVRKYFGIKDHGDFLLVARYPKELFDYYPIMHSTQGPEHWLRTYGEHGRNWLTSYRNPMDVFNSAAHSINALTSEYIQRYLHTVKEEDIRHEIGLSKLSDPKVCKGLIKYQIDGWRAFFPIAQYFKHYRWEDLITNPAHTVQQLAKMVDISLSEEEAIAIWRPLDHRNLLNHHTHNFRINKGIIDDWKNSVIPEHLTMFEELGGKEIFAELGYDWPELPSELNDYQKTIQRYWQSGKPYEIKDKNLAGFAFNKSNIDASDYVFTSLPERGRISIERSDLGDSNLVRAFHDYAVEVNNQLVDLIQQVLISDNDASVERLLIAQYGEQDTTNFLSVLQRPIESIEQAIEKFLADKHFESIIIWGMGTDFNRWITHSTQAKSLLSKPNITLVDRARCGENIFGKVVLEPDSALQLTEHLVLPFVFGYETRQAILQQCQRHSLHFVDLHTCLKQTSNG